MNIANKLTILRIFLAFICIGLTLGNTFGYLVAALIIFGIASFTDFLDGYLARKKNLTSDLGKLLDPIADKILIIGVFCAFFDLRIISVWMLSLIMFREFLVTGFRLYGLNRGVVLDAKRFGKHKTVFQVAGIIVIFIALILSKVFPEGRTVFFLYKFIPLVMWYIVIVTLLSGGYYLWLNRKAVRTF